MEYYLPLAWYNKVKFNINVMSRLIFLIHGDDNLRVSSLGFLYWVLFLPLMPVLWHNC